MADEQEVYVLWNGESFKKGHLFKEPRKKKKERPNDPHKTY